MRCDLHVHSWFSGGAGVPVLDHLGRECYSNPLEVYERARLRGMDLVTLTDHDTVEGAMRLAHLPECFLSEELTLHLEGGRQLCVPAGRSGSYARLTSEVARIFAAGYAETWGELRRGTAHPLRLAASAVLMPLLPLIPLFTLAVHAHELAFGLRHFRAFQEAFGWPAQTRRRPALGAPPLEEVA